MIVIVYVVIAPNGDRPYVSTQAPTPERYEALRSQGCYVFEAPIRIPEIKAFDVALRTVEAEVYRP